MIGIKQEFNLSPSVLAKDLLAGFLQSSVVTG